MLLAVRISSYRCTCEVWKVLEKLELLLAAPRATLNLRFFRAVQTFRVHP